MIQRIFLSLVIAATFCVSAKIHAQEQAEQTKRSPKRVQVMVLGTFHCDQKATTTTDAGQLQEDATKPFIWDMVKRTEYAKRQFNSELWNWDLFKEDMDGAQRHIRSVKPAISSIPSPVPKYEAGFGGLLRPISAKIGGKTVCGYSVGWSQCKVNRHLFKDDKEFIHLYFTILVLTDESMVGRKAAHLVSRNYPHLLVTGKILTPNGDVDWIQTAFADGDDYAVVSARVFDLHFGSTILVAPQKDGSLRFMQLQSPAGITSAEVPNEIDQHLEELAKNDKVVEFISNPNAIDSKAGNSSFRRLSESEKLVIRTKIATMIDRDQQFRPYLQYKTLDDALIRRISQMESQEQARFMREHQIELPDSEKSLLEKLQHQNDVQNHFELRELIRRYGYPSAERLSVKSDLLFPLLLRPPTKTTQDVEAYLKEMSSPLKLEVLAGHMPAKSYAMFWDNINVKILKRGQLYGTNRMFNPKTQQLDPPVVTDIELTNKARKEIGLPPLTEGQYQINNKRSEK